jgi:CHAD domain-containing protein
VTRPDAIELAPGEPFAAAGARIVRRRADELFALADGVLDVDDAEAVHDMRVASRRLRAALEVFTPCFPRRRHAAVLREVKALADALGERRDPDVRLAALAALAADAPPPLRPGIELLAARTRNEQAAGNAALAGALEAARAGDLHGRLQGLADAGAGVAEGSG